MNNKTRIKIFTSSMVFMMGQCFGMLLFDDAVNKSVFIYEIALICFILFITWNINE